jgi:hypothetical protein
MNWSCLPGASELVIPGWLANRKLARNGLRVLEPDFSGVSAPPPFYALVPPPIKNQPDLICSAGSVKLHLVFEVFSRVTHSRM